jgi:hypothetical protein
VIVLGDSLCQRTGKWEICQILREGRSLECFNHVISIHTTAAACMNKPLSAEFFYDAEKFDV